MQQKWRRRFHFLTSAILSFSLLGFTVPVAPVTAATTLTKSVAGWIPYWDQTRAMSVAQNNPDIFNELSPFWYDLGSSGELVPLANSEDSSIISYAQTNNKNLIPLISNEFNATLVSSIINNPTLAQTNITNIVNKVTSMGYTGIDIDYENILTTDKAAYSAFIQNLSAALHTRGKLLVVTLQAKTSSTANWNGPGGEDYVAIGQAADKIRVMAYDYHWNTSTAGSIAPASWVDQVVAYTVSAVPAAKVELGVPNYGYDWVGSQGKGITYSQAIATANTYGAVITEDAQNGPHYSYTVNGVSHEVWFEDATSFSTLLDIVNKYNINGIAIWRLGEEDPNNYTAIRAKFSSGTTSTSTSSTTSSTTTTTTTSSTASTTDTTSASTSGSVSSGSTTTTDSTSTATSTSTTTSSTPTSTTTTSSDTSSTSTSATSTSGTSTSTTTDTLAPSLSFTYTVYKNSIKLSANASDNVGVKKVEFYFDGRLIATDFSAPYEAYYKGKRTNSYHTLTVIAYDTAGNKTTVQKTVKY